jgi:hypothetical protein
MRQRARVRLQPDLLESRDTPVIFNGAGFPPPLATSGPADGTVTLFPPLLSTGQFNNQPGAPVVIAPFGPIPAQIRTAFADVNGDAIQDLIAITGPGVPVEAIVLDGRDFVTPLTPAFDPFGNAAPNTAPPVGSSGFFGGGFVAAGDIDHDGRAEFVFTPDVGGGPRVVIYSLVGTTPILRTSFFGIDDPAFRGGARPALGDLNGDGFADLAVAAGFGGGPRVAVYNGITLLTSSGQPQKLVSDFFAFPDSDAETLRNGVFIAAGDINTDGFADLVFGGGPGGGPRVLAISGFTLVTSGPVAAESSPVANFFSGDPTTRGGIRVAAKPVGIGTKAEIVTGSGENLFSDARVYFGVIPTSGEPTPFQDINPYNQVLPGGVYVG